MSGLIVSEIPKHTVTIDYPHCEKLFPLLLILFRLKTSRTILINQEFIIMFAYLGDHKARTDMKRCILVFDTDTDGLDLIL